MFFFCRKRSKDDILCFTPGELTESPYIGAAFLTGLGVQLSGGAGGLDQDDDLKKKRSYLVRNLTWKQLGLNVNVEEENKLLEGYIHKVFS